MPPIDTYDPATYVAGSFATYPPLPAGVELYQPAMWWDSIGAGDMDGVPVAVGDRIYATGRGRFYGDFLFGDLVYGNPPDRDWPPELVSWLTWDASLPPDVQPPFPYTGCRFGESGQFTPGQWHIVIDALFNDVVGSRTYGDLTYGDEVYGDVDAEGRYRWNDITRPSYSVIAVVGTDDGRPAVPVNTLEVELVDSDGSWLDMADPWWWYQPFVGAPIRVGFFDPDWRYWPIIVGTIEQVVDDHDAPPRTVRVQAFGNDRELAGDLLGWQRPDELVSTRFRALMTAGGWRFGEGELVFPDDANLHADQTPRDVTARAELDRTVMSAGWFFDTDRWGGPRLREWPHVPEGAALEVVDCHDGELPGALVSPLIRYVADESQLLNVAALSNDADPQLVVTAEEPASINRFGRRGRAMGFPQTGLAFADASAASAMAVRYVNRWAYVVRQVATVDADTKVDGAWLEALVELDTGRAVEVTRTAFHRFTMAGVIVGMTHRITPYRMQSVLNVATTTGTM